MILTINNYIKKIWETQYPIQFDLKISGLIQSELILYNIVLLPTSNLNYVFSIEFEF